MGSGWAWLYFWGVGGSGKSGISGKMHKNGHFSARDAGQWGRFLRKSYQFIYCLNTPPHPTHFPPHPPPTPHIPVTNPHPTPEINKYSHTAIIISRIIINKYILFLFNKILFIYPHAHRYTPGSAPRLIPKNKSRAPSSP